MSIAFSWSYWKSTIRWYEHGKKFKRYKYKNLRKIRSLLTFELFGWNKIFKHFVNSVNIIYIFQHFNVLILIVYNKSYLLYNYRSQWVYNTGSIEYFNVVDIEN